MNEFFRRIEPVAPASNTTERVSIGVRAISPVAPVTARTGGAAGSPKNRRHMPGQEDAYALVGDDRARAAAAYAQVHAKITGVLSDLKAQSAPAHPAMLEAAEHSILSLMPQPAIVLPLPPAGEDMVQFVAQVTQSIAQQAAQTRAAQSGASPAVVDAAVA